MPAHLKHGDAVSPAAFERWLSSCRETIDKFLEPGPAAALQEKADRIAQSLSLGIAFHRDRRLGLGVPAAS